MAQRHGFPSAQLAAEVQPAIDGLAEALTGDRTHFHLKPHGGFTGPRG